MGLSQLDKGLLPYEKKLRAQERLRRFLGVKEVDRPTYEKYITGPIERFDRRKTTFLTLNPANPFGEEYRKRFRARTGNGSREPLPYSELEPEDRIGQSMTLAGWRLAREYNPEPLSVTPPEGRVEVTNKAWMTRLIKKVALFYGAELVRITRLDQRWVYQDINISHKYAIIVVVSHVNSLIDTAPSHFSAAAMPGTYSPLKFIITQLADFVRGLGYDAAYRMEEIQLVPLAMDAGVGEFARTGRVLSPEFGINMRFRVVTTDLPLEVDKPISFGVHEFCTVCESCATYCPANAVPFGPPTDEPLGIYNNPGCRKWYINAEKCLTFWSVNKKKWTGCGARCIAVCPWNKPLVPSHNTVRWIAIHSPAAVKKMITRADQLMYKRTKKINRR